MARTVRVKTRHTADAIRGREKEWCSSTLGTAGTRDEVEVEEGDEEGDEGLDSGGLGGGALGSTNAGVRGIPSAEK